MKHLLLEIVEATEAAALAASKYVGSGDKLTIDRVASESMRQRLDLIRMSAEVVIGEGKKDESYGLFQGERVGLGSRTKFCDSENPPKDLDDPRWQLGRHEYEIAVDPVEGTTPTAKGGYEAMSVIAVGGHGSLMATDAFYMDKIAVGKKVADYYEPHIGTPLTAIIQEVSRVLNKQQVTVCMLDRERHNILAQQLRRLGCRINFITDCDVSGAIAAALPESGIDIFMGIGGAPEGVLAAAAIKCLGGYFEGQLVDKADPMTGYHRPIGNTYIAKDLAKGDVMFAATGITNGSLLKGVRFEGNGVITHSILMESASRSLKRVESYYER